MPNEITLSEYNTELAIFLIPNTVILWLYFVIGVTGNAVSLFVYGFRIKDLKEKRFFIPYLAAIDLLSIIAGSAFAISLNILPVKFRGDILCKSLWFSCAVFATASCFLLLVICVQRYLEVCKPHGSQMTSYWKRVALVLTATLALGISVPNIFFHGEVQVNNSKNITGYRCGILDEAKYNVTFLAYNCFLFSINITGVITMTVIYSLIGRDIFRLMKRKEKRKSSTSMALQSINVSQRKSLSLDSLDVLGTNTDRLSNSDVEGTPRSRSNSIITEYAIRGSFRVKTHFQRHRHSWMCMMISMFYVISFTPRVSIMFIESVYPTFWEKLNSFQIRMCLFFYRLYILNHVINPFFFGLFDKLFREQCRKLFCSKCQTPTTEL